MPDIKPARVPSRPKAIRVAPLAGTNELTRTRPRRVQVARAKPGTNTNAVALGVAIIAGVAVGGATWLATRDRDDPRDD